MLFSLGLLLFQPKPVSLFDRAIDDLYRLRVVATYSGSTDVRVLLVDQRNAGRFWELARLTEPYELYFKVERADQASIVLSRTTEYGIQMAFSKVFFSASSRHLLKRINFNAHESLK